MSAQVLSYGSILVLWVVGARALGPAILPGPVVTYEFIAKEFARGVLMRHLWVTTERVLIAFAIALLIGVIVGAAMGVSKRVDDLLQGWLVVTLTVPRILLFVVAYLTIGLSDRALILALIITVVPTIAVTVREGALTIDRHLVEMARAFRRSPSATWRVVILPQLLPYVVGTARASLALTWKMVVLGELLGRTSGVGYQISFYFQFFNMAGILAYGFTMMFLLAVIDQGVMGTIQRLAFRWRSPLELQASSVG